MICGKFHLSHHRRDFGMFAWTIEQWTHCLAYKRCWKKWFSLLSSLAQTVIPPFSPLLSTEKSLTVNLADKHVWDIHPSWNMYQLEASLLIWLSGGNMEIYFHAALQPEYIVQLRFNPWLQSEYLKLSPTTEQDVANIMVAANSQRKCRKPMLTSLVKHCK